MAHTYEELSKKALSELRDLAKGLSHEAVQGHTQMNKEHLLPALCKALGIEAREHHAVVGVDKARLKTRIRALKVERGKALEARNHKQLRAVRRQIHRQKRKLRAATV